MRLHRYKAKFTGASSHHRYANLTTWMFGGIMIVGLIMFILPSPLKGSRVWYVFGCMLLTMIPLFFFKLLAQEYNVFGKVISILSGFLCAALLIASAYFAGVGGGLHALLAATYYGILSWLSYNEYNEIQHT